MNAHTEEVILRWIEPGNWSVHLRLGNAETNFEEVADLGKYCNNWSTERVIKGYCGPWGYEGNGPQCLSKAILSCWFGEEVADEYGNLFYRQFLLYMNPLGGSICKGQVSAWLSTMHRQKSMRAKKLDHCSPETQVAFLEWLAQDLCSEVTLKHSNASWILSASSASLTISYGGGTLTEAIVGAQDEAEIQLRQRRLPTFDEFYFKID